MPNEFYARVSLKRDTEANWNTNNPIINNGEMIIVDTADGKVRTKIGDGSKRYSALEFTDSVVPDIVNEAIQDSKTVWQEF